MYKHGAINDFTLMWREGDRDWEQLLYQRLLRPMLLQQPVVPPAVGVFKTEQEVYDPIIEIPELSELNATSESVIPLNEPDMTRYCFKCGNIAVAQIRPADRSQLEKLPDYYAARQNQGLSADFVGSTNFASECLPAFLWIGSFEAARKRYGYGNGYGYVWVRVRVRVWIWIWI